MTEDIIENKHSDEIQEIITKVPSWIIRWGIVIFGVILLMALSISAIIHYPDIIKFPIKLHSISKSTEVFGVFEISEDYFTKVKPGQQVNIHLKIYPSEEYGQLNGQIISISDEPNEKGRFTVKVKLNTSGIKQSVKLKSWMTGEAEVITQDVTVLERIVRNMYK